MIQIDVLKTFKKLLKVITVHCIRENETLGTRKKGSKRFISILRGD